MSFISLILCNFWFSTVFRHQNEKQSIQKNIPRNGINGPFRSIWWTIDFVAVFLPIIINREKKAITEKNNEKKMGMLLYNRLVLRANACLQTIRIIQLSSILFIDFDYENLWQCMFSVHCSYIVITKKKNQPDPIALDMKCSELEFFPPFRGWLLFTLRIHRTLYQIKNYVYLFSSYIEMTSFFSAMMASCLWPTLGSIRIYESFVRSYYV